LSEHALEAAVIHKLAAGEEELIPAQFANRMIVGESPLRVYREYRSLTQTALAKVGFSAETLELMRQIAAYFPRKGDQ